MVLGKLVCVTAVLLVCVPTVCSGDTAAVRRDREVLAERAKRMTAELPARAALARQHPFQTWLHNYMRGLGKDLTPADRIRPGGSSQLSRALAGKPVLAEGEDGDGGVAEPTYKDIDITEPIFMEEGEFTKHADEWMTKHQSEMRTSVRWMLMGGLLCLAATCVLIYSEVRTVLMTRDLDTAAVQGIAPSSSLRDHEEQVTNERRYLSLGALVALVVGTMTVLFALCNLANGMLNSMGYQFHGCHQMAFLVSYVAVALFAMVIVGVCWICTRPWTAALLISFSLLGDMALESGSAASVILWVLVTVAAFYVWFKWGKHMGMVEDPYGDQPSERDALLDTTAKQV
jgi:hypothetical protein